MKIDVLNIEGAKVSQVTTKKEFFEAPVNNGLLYEAVKMNRSNKREGNACTKNRAEVSGSGKKLWKQKGTGGAG